MNQTQMQTEALQRATQNESLTNYPEIFRGFGERGIPEADIKPRENVFTYQAWRALGKQVKRGEHGIRITTWIKSSREVKKLDGTTEEKAYSFPRSAVVFHVSQVK